MKDTKRILLVEDDPSLAEWVAEYLADQGFAMAVAGCGEQALEMARREAPDLVLLDVMLPDLSGLEVCRRLRPEFGAPILMLTACSQEGDELAGFDSGADDYLAKPVRPRVLLARIQALLSRGDRRDSQRRVQIGTLDIDPDSRSVTLDGEAVDLSANEYELLWLLARSAGQILPRAQLLEELCGYDYDGFNRTVDVRISRLRKKLQDNAARPYRIKTVRGKGYLLALDAW